MKNGMGPSGKVIVRDGGLLVAVGVVVFAALILLRPHEARAQTGYVGSEKCKTCHGRLSDTWAKNVHARTLVMRDLPADLRGCESCHGPGAVHASTMDKTKILNPAKLAPTRVNAVCAKCHLRGADVRITDPWGGHDNFFWMRSAHQKKGVSCLSCHTGHQAATRQPVAQLCGSCHADISGTAGQYTHFPVAQGRCTLCHDPHGTSRRYGLSADLPKTCQGCHDVSTRASVTAHKGFNVRTSDCMSCHSPHSRDRRTKLVKAQQHVPFARGQCTACHVQASSALLKPQGQLCASCHDMSKVRDPKEAVVHFPVAKEFCIGCHAPHAAREQKLLKDKPAYVCLDCHGTIERETIKPNTHRPVDEGACVTCHRPHTSTQPNLLAREQVSLCATCHGRHTRFTHPLGEKYKDPTGAPITCSTCHALHGANFRYLAQANPQRELCLRCHRITR